VESRGRKPEIPDYCLKNAPKSPKFAYFYVFYIICSMKSMNEISGKALMAFGVVSAGVTVITGGASALLLADAALVYMGNNKRQNRGFITGKPEAIL
jgi:hypothetical protein